MGAMTSHVIDDVRGGRHHEIVRMSDRQVSPVSWQQHIIACSERNTRLQVQSKAPARPFGSRVDW
ncbi:hypothetical protein CJO82_00555 [Ralstonia solanacearum]|nr:hypothetical protein CJO82_00555 [Ralstonia solanacearum]AXW17811.1 hypothetical protein CJO85_00560 [Ralstonia solanacearum]AXW22216.1 hypothetical protein CJO86_00555 [Ralstonia solanacearum]AXW79113.1 hypothetical protein CJO98_00555 [Ralstonia solanacearum]